MNTRVEHDLLGEKAIDAELHYGIHTARALENFPFSGDRVHHELIRALASVKDACAMSNAKLEYLDPQISKAISGACYEIKNLSSFDEDFPLPALQGGAGTSINMNVNEVVANRALSILGLPFGEYAKIDPLHHVNMHQSTNDVFPTALKIALIKRFRDLAAAAAELQGALQRREKAFADIVSMGRTEMQDAVPVTLGAQFGAMAEAVARDRWRAFKCEERLRVVNIGGTAVGTGLAAPRDYIFLVIETLREITSLPLARADLAMDATANADCYVEVCGMLSAMAANLVKIAGDLRMLNYFGEIKLPAVQAGSSIMPGKVNPVVMEAVIAAGIKAQSNCSLVDRCASMGTFQINEFLPTIADAMLRSIDMLIDAAGILAGSLDKTETDAQVCRDRVDAAPTMITAFVPYIGYEKATTLVKEWIASSREISLKEFLKTKIDQSLVEKVLSGTSLMSLGFRKQDLTKGEKE